MKNTYKMVLAALFLSLGLVLPSLTLRIPEIGRMLLPMHIPVLICGFVCGYKYGLLVGFITPLLHSIRFQMPPLLPDAVSMAFELATYGLLVGLLYKLLKGKKLRIYFSLLPAMIAGRIVWGIVRVIIAGVSKYTFSYAAFIGGALLNAIPGIILQIVLIPTIILTLEKSGVLKIDD